MTAASQWFRVGFLAWALLLAAGIAGAIVDQDAPALESELQVEP